MSRREFPLSVNEELFLRLDTPAEPQNMHLEVRFEGTLEAARMSAAASSATASHPMTRARLARRRLMTLPPRWTLSTADVPVAVTEQHAGSDQDMQRIRSGFYSHGFDVRIAPLVRILVVHRSGGDSLLLSMHHAIADGVGLARYLDSLLRGYAGKPDVPPAAVDPIEVRYLSKYFGGRYPAPAVPPPKAAKPTGERSFLAPSPASTDQGYLFECVRLPQDWKQSDRRHRDLRGSRGEYIMHAALHRAIDDWNCAHSSNSDAISTMVPINIRDAQWKRDVVANIVLSIELTTTPADRITDDDLIAAITAQIRSARAGDSFGASLHPSAAVRNVLVPVLFTLPKRLVRRFAADAAVLTCAGPGDDFLPEKQFAGKVIEVWGSPPTAKPMGVALCAMSLGDDVFITLRFSRSLFDDAAARQFSALYLEALERFSLAGQVASARPSRRATSAPSLTPTTH